MKDLVKNLRRISVLFAFAALLAVSPAFTSGPLPSAVEVSCPVPTVTRTGQTSTSLTYGWQHVQSGSSYRIWYRRTSDSFTSSPVTTTGTSATLSGLSSDTYQVFFEADCGAEKADIIIVDVVIL
jgi:hypothetical protein